MLCYPRVGSGKINAEVNSQVFWPSILALAITSPINILNSEVCCKYKSAYPDLCSRSAGKTWFMLIAALITLKMNDNSMR